MVKLTDVTGIGSVAAKVLAEHNIKTVEALASISLAELQKISGFSGDIRARAVKKAASDCLHKAAKQVTAPVKSAQPSAQPVVKKKTVSEETVASRALNQAETDKAEGEKKNKKDDKKKEKVKDKKKKEKNKDKKKKKDSKKKGKDKKKS